MYHVYVNDESIGDYNVVFIYLGKNGSYVPCRKKDAEGICIKVPREEPLEIRDDDSDEAVQEMTTVYDDSVFALREGALKGTEPVCRIEEI